MCVRIITHTFQSNRLEYAQVDLLVERFILAMLRCQEVQGLIKCISMQLYPKLYLRSWP